MCSLCKVQPLVFMDNGIAAKLGGLTLYQATKDEWNSEPKGWEQGQFGLVFQNEPQFVFNFEPDETWVDWDLESKIINSAHSIDGVAAFYTHCVKDGYDPKNHMFSRYLSYKLWNILATHSHVPDSH